MFSGFMVRELVGWRKYVSTGRSVMLCLERHGLHEKRESVS